MKRQAALFIFLILFANVSIAQGFAVKIQDGYYFPVLTKLKGSTPDSYFQMEKIYCPDISIEYLKSSGLFFSGTIGAETDRYHFSTRMPFPNPVGPLAIDKKYSSVPVIFSSGYVYNFGRSRFRLNTQAGIGFGFIKSTDFDRNHSLEGWVTLSGQSGIENDSQHVRIVIEDSPMKKVLAQVRASVSLEYHLKHLFARTTIEARSWLSAFETVKYHSEYDSTLFHVNQTNDGYYRVRPGYFGISMGLGWYFNSLKN